MVLYNLKTYMLANEKKNCTKGEDVWGSGDIAPPFLTSTLDGGEWSASRPDRFTTKTSLHIHPLCVKSLLNICSPLLFQ
jgi:hypothetical protein